MKPLQKESPVFGFVPQSHLEPIDDIARAASDHGTASSLSYTYLRQPSDRLHPDNLVVLPPELDAAVSAAESSDLPERLIRSITRLRHPVLWDAVRTSIPITTANGITVSSRLDAHLADLRSQPPASAAPAGGRSPRRPKPGVVLIDRMPVAALVIDVPGVAAAVGFEFEGCVVTAVVPRAFRRGIRREFARVRPAGITLESDLPAAVRVSA